MWRDDPHFVKLKITPKPQICQSCGCQCNQCSSADGFLDYHHRIEELESEVREYREGSSRLEIHIMEMEAAARSEHQRRDEEMARQRDRYDRLMESHKKLSRLNQTLEDQLLSVVTKYEGEKSHLMQEISMSRSKLEEAKQVVIDLEQENKRCKNECSIAVQLLQTRPNDYVAQKLGSLPDDLKERLEQTIPREELLQMQEEIEAKQKKAKPTLTVMPTFPPCAALFSAPQGPTSAMETDPPAAAPDSSRVCNRQLARVFSEASSLKRLAPEPGSTLLVEFVCVRCRGRVSRTERACQTLFSAPGDGFEAALVEAAAVTDADRPSGDTGGGWRPASESSGRVHRATFSSSSYVSAGPFSGAILDV